MCGCVMSEYWKRKLGAGESIIILDDFIEGQISFPTKNENFNPITDCQVTLKQFSDADSEEIVCELDECEITFPARKLRRLLKTIMKAKESDEPVKYKVNEHLKFAKNGKNYILESDDIIMITDIDDFCTLLQDLLLVFNEMID